MSEDSLLERVTAAAEERHLSKNTLTAYRRTWLRLIAWSAAEGLALQALSSERAGEFYEEATRGRSASLHLQVKAALALVYYVLGSANPFAECAAPKFAPEKTEPPQSNARAGSSFPRQPLNSVPWLLQTVLSTEAYDKRFPAGLVVGFHPAARRPSCLLAQYPGIRGNRSLNGFLE